MNKFAALPLTQNSQTLRQNGAKTTERFPLKQAINGRTRHRSETILAEVSWKTQAPLQDNTTIQNAKEGLHENGDLIKRSDAHHH